MKEVDKVCGLIPEKGISSEERKRQNKIVRGELSILSNYAICYLAIIVKHQLSLKELKERLERRLFNDLRELFWLIELVYFIYNTKNNKLYDLAMKEVERITPSVNSREIVEIVKYYMDTGIANRTIFLERMILYSPCANEIIRDIKRIKSSEEMIGRIKILATIKNK